MMKVEVSVISAKFSTIIKTWLRVGIENSMTVENLMGL
jgi:hypothetical protein